MEKDRIAAYDGNASYVFISYAHADEKRVLPVISLLCADKYRVWYDGGIVAGESWPQKVAVRLRDSSVFIAFTSKSFFNSQNCLREINYAVANKKEMLRIDLDGSPTPEGMAMQLSVVPKTDAGKLSANETAESIIKGTLTDTLKGDESLPAAKQKHIRKKVNPWMTASIIICTLFLSLSLAVVGYIRGWFSLPDGTIIKPVNAQITDSGETVTYIEWNNSLTRSVFLSSLNSSSVFICGNKCISSANAIAYNDKWCVLGEPVENGGTASFTELGNPEKITQLSLVYQSITDLSDIGVFQALTYLDISGNEIHDISPLQKLSSLETLIIRHIPAADLSVLKDIPSLRRVYISSDMSAAAEMLLDADFDIIIKK